MGYGEGADVVVRQIATEVPKLELGNQGSVCREVPLGER